MSRFQVVADAIYYDGSAVGRLSSNISSSMRFLVEDLLETARLPDENSDDVEKVDLPAVINTIAAQAALASQAGMIELSELSAILAKLQNEN